MNSILRFAIIFSLFLINTLNLTAQYSILGVGGIHGKYSASELGVNTSLTGIHSMIETPLNNYSLRFGFDYLTRIGKESLLNRDISHLSIIKLLAGKIINEGRVLQFPILVGGGIFIPNGDIELPEEKKSLFSVTASAGVRVYIGRRVAIFSEVSMDGAILTNYQYVDNIGNSVTSNVVNYIPSLSIGACFVYKQER